VSFNIKETKPGPIAKFCTSWVIGSVFISAGLLEKSRTEASEVDFR
jgi:hypothetical protein